MNTCLNSLKVALLLIVLAFPLMAQKRATPVNLIVTIDDTYAQAGGFRSDAGGNYVNGQSGVILERQQPASARGSGATFWLK